MTTKAKQDQYRRIATGKLCPECFSVATESNGHTEYRCIKCDHRWGVDMGAPYGYDHQERWFAWLDGRVHAHVSFYVPVGSTVDIAQAGADALGVDLSESVNVERAR